jgi:SHS2 domain-containing protein
VKFRTIEHTADIGIEVEASTLEELFSGAARAMFSLIVEEGTAGRSVERQVSLDASDLEELMFRWLNELVFLVSAERLVFSVFDVLEVRDDHLSALVRGGPLEEAGGGLELEIKAATYHELSVERRGEEWFARAIFDV